MRTVRNEGTQARVHNKIKCYPKQYAELPDGVADMWVKHFNCVYVDAEHKPAKETPKRPRKKPEDSLEGRI